MVCPFNEAALPVSELVAEPGYFLLGGEVLGQVVAEPGKFHISALDQPNAFSYVEVPAHWWPWQSAPRVKAGDLPTSWVRGRWPPSRWLRPQYRRLPMGHTHAVLFLCR